MISCISITIYCKGTVFLLAAVSYAFDLTNLSITFWRVSILDFVTYIARYKLF